LGGAAIKQGGDERAIGNTRGYGERLVNQLGKKWLTANVTERIREDGGERVDISHTDFKPQNKKRPDLIRSRQDKARPLSGKE